MESQAQRALAEEFGSSESARDDQGRSDSMSNSMSESGDEDHNGNGDGEQGGSGARKKRERRSKDDSSKRNYICGCGKKYLSYAALYTHTKVKHNGSFPEGTVMLNKKKQGRPKEEMPDPRHQTALQRRKLFATTFSQFLDKIDKAKCPSDKAGAYDPLTVGMSDLQVQLSIIKPIRDAVREIGDQLKKKHGDDYQKKIEEYTGELTRDKISCDMAFGLFALYASKFVSKEFYEELIIFLALYRKAMDDKGWEKLDQIKTGNKEKLRDESFCATQTAEFVPDISNVFILEYLPTISHSKQVVSNPDTLRFLGLDDTRLSWAILLITQICNWLYLHGCTQAKLELKQTLT